MKKQGWMKRTGGSLLLALLIILFVVLSALHILTGELTTSIVRIGSFLPVFLAAIMLFAGKEEKNAKKPLFVILCIGATASFSLVIRLSPLKEMLSNVFGSGATLLIPGLDREGRAVSALLLGILFGIVFLIATMIGIGKQKKGHKMKRRPLDQLIQALLTAVLGILIAISLFLTRGLPLAVLVSLILFLIIKAIPAERLSFQSAAAFALIASACAGVMLGAAL